MPISPAVPAGHASPDPSSPASALSIRVTRSMAVALPQDRPVVASASSVPGRSGRRVASDSPPLRIEAKRHQAVAASAAGFVKFTLPSFELHGAGGESWSIASSSVVTPVLADEAALLRSATSGERGPAQAVPMWDGTGFHYSLLRGGVEVGKAHLFVDVAGCPVSFSVGVVQRGIKAVLVRCGRYRDNAGWRADIFVKRQHRKAVNQLLGALDDRGATLDELGVRGWPVSAVRIVLASAACRHDDVGHAVWHELARQQLSPATLAWAEKDALLQVLQAVAAERGGYLRLTMSELRWLPPRDVMGLVNALFPARGPGRTASASYMRQVMRLSEPIGGVDWPISLYHQTNGSPHSSELDWLLRTFFAYSNSAAQRSNARSLILALERTRAPGEPPLSIQDVAAMDADTMKALGISPYLSDAVVTAQGIMTWVHRLVADSLQARYMRWVAASGNEEIPGPPMPLPSLDLPKALPKDAGLRAELDAARATFQRQCDDGAISRACGMKYLSGYGKLLMELERAPLGELLRSPALVDVLTWMVDAARPIFEADRVRHAAGDRSRVLADCSMLYLPLRERLVQSVTADPSMLRRALHQHLGWPLHGQSTPDHYEPRLWFGSRVTQACEELPGIDEARAIDARAALRAVVRHADERWRPDEPHPLAGALLGPDGWLHADDESAEQAIDVDGIASAGVALLVDRRIGDKRVKAAIACLVGQPWAQELIGDRALCWPDLLENREKLEVLAQAQDVFGLLTETLRTTSEWDVVGMWMRYHEGRMGPSDGVNGVRVALDGASDGSSFLAVVRADLEACRGEFERKAAGMPEEPGPAMAAARRAGARLEKLRSSPMDSPHVRDTFLLLHEQHACADEADEVQPSGDRMTVAMPGLIDPWGGDLFLQELEALGTVDMFRTQG